MCFLGWLRGDKLIRLAHAYVNTQLEAAEAAVAATGAGMGATGAATMCTVDLRALQAEHDAMAQELQFLREVSASSCPLTSSVRVCVSAG